MLDLAFSTLAAPSGPVLLDYRSAAAEAEDGSPLQASAVQLVDGAHQADFATEVTLMRRYWEQRLAKTGRTAIGLSKIPPQRFRGVVRFLEEYVTDSQADMAERPPDTPLPLFIRLCIEDLRVMYVEGRLQTHPSESSEDRQRWLLGTTAFGAFLRKLRDVMDKSEDPKTKAAAFGIAR